MSPRQSFVIFLLPSVFWGNVDAFVNPHTMAAEQTLIRCRNTPMTTLTKQGTHRSMVLSDEEELGLKKMKADDRDFWMRQKELTLEMQESTAGSLKAEMKEKFAKRRNDLIRDTMYIGFLIFCVLWCEFTNPFVASSYALGTTLGVAYSYGLGRYVESVGASVDDQGTAEGAGVGEARFAFVILLFVVIGKFRSAGLMEIPSIAGFFTYQVASLRQGLKQYDD